MSTRKLRFAAALTPEGWRDDVLIEVDASGRIAAVTPGSGEGGRIPGAAVPAMANIHSHAHQRFMAGLAERAGPGADSFWTWRETMYGFAQRLDPEDLEAVASQLYVEMLKAGFSSVGEFQYLHHQPDGTPYADPAELSLRCLAAAEAAGIAITLLPALYSHGGFGGTPANPGQRRFINPPDRFLRLFESLSKAKHPLRRLGIAPHSLRAVTVAGLGEVIAAIPVEAPVHIHIAEQVKEVEDCVAWCGRRPVELLLDSFEASSRWCAIHATHMTGAETDALARSGVIAGLCPTTEANLGDGIFPAVRFMAANGAVAIGSDSHISVSIAEDLRQLEYSQRLRDLTRNALAAAPGQSTGRRMFDAALAGGAQALTQPTGSLAPGHRADIAVLDTGHPALLGRGGDSLIDSWIFSAGNAAVRDVYVAGAPIVVDRRHVNEERILARFRAAVQRLTS